MASTCTFSSPILFHKKISQSQNGNISLQKSFCSSQTRTMAVITTKPIVRRSGNYQPLLWSFDYVQSLTSIYGGENSEPRSYRLNEVKKMIYNERKVEKPLSCLKLVDDLQRLGISYYFMDEISNLLEIIYYNYYKNKATWDKTELNFKALGFRLLRQHGYDIPKEIFHDIKDENGNFKACLCKDTLGVLNLYEASYLAEEDESILDEASDFTRNCLKEILENDNVVDQITLALIRHALELPLHWRVPRVEVKWFIEIYEKRSGMNPLLAELAKLDFNMVQAIHQEDLKDPSKWWKSTCWDKKLHFARDRIVENFLWTIGINYLPQFRTGRRTLTKIDAIITTIDDVYDVYGTLDELEKFTDITTRWDINAIDELPDYMKICFLGFSNAINEIVYDTLSMEGLLIISYLKKAWTDLCKSYLVEAQWYHNGYIPALEEYLNNACVSIGAPVILTHVYFLTSSNFADKALERMETANNIVCYSSLILRLADDLGTSSVELEKGDVPKSIQCYMHENGATEEKARAYIKTLIAETWKKLNKERKAAHDLLSSEFIECATNLGRMAKFMYFKGDGHGSPDLSKSHVLSLLVNPIHV